MHPEALTGNGREIFEKLKKIEGFYLAGGTALALQIGHRISVDFDFFTQDNISADLPDKIKKIFVEYSITSSVNNTDELTVFIEGTKVSFIRYPFPIICDTVKLEGMSMLSIKEIGVTKAYTIGRRGSFKDYIDLFFMLKEQYSSLNELINLADKKYGAEFNGRLFLEQLTYREDIKDTAIVLLRDQSTTKDMIFNFFIQQIREITL